MIKNLFVPVDGSELSERAMTESVALARQLGAAITAFIAEPDTPLPNLGTNVNAYQRAASAHEARTDAHAQQVLSRFEALARAEGVPFEGLHLRTEQIDRSIAETAQARGCDMIVMATHGRGPVGEFLFGSVTKSVLAHSRLPVLILR